MISADPDPSYSALLADSLRRLTGMTIDPWNDTCAIVSHGPAPDRMFRWANPVALALWQTDWETFTRMSSRESVEADPNVQSTRDRHLDEVTRHGYVPDYQGVRISTKGRRFRIRNTLVWSVSDRRGAVIGQAARIGSVERLD